MITLAKRIYRFFFKIPGFRFLNKLGLWWVYRKASVHKLESRLRQFGHFVDKSLYEGSSPSCTALMNLEYLVLRSEKRGKDPAIGWAKQLLLRARYPELAWNDSSETATITAGSIEEVIRGRRSVRKWMDRQVDRRLLYEIINIAQWAPSSCNRQPWKFLVVESEEGRQLLGALFPQKFYAKAPMLLVVLMDLDVYDKDEKSFKPYLDGAAIIQNALLLMHARGLGACWISFDLKRTQGDSLSRVMRHFRIPDNYLPISMIAVGYAAKTPADSVRKNVSDLLWFETADDLTV